jgi:type I restriction enzyme M protein
LTAEDLRKVEEAIKHLDPEGRFVELDTRAKRVRYSDEITRYQAIGLYEGQEEPARAFIVAWLCTLGGYLPANLELEKRYSLGRPKVGAKLDVLIRHPDGSTYALIEVKAPAEYEINSAKFIKGQLFDIAPHEPGASVLAYATIRADAKVQILTQTIAYDGKLKFADWALARSASNVLPRNYGEPVHVHFVKGSPKDLREDVSPRELEAVRKRLHDVLWGGSTADNTIYAYLVRLFLAKIFDEKNTETNQAYKFQLLYKGNVREPVVETFVRVNSLYQDAYNRYLNINGQDPPEPLNSREFSEEQMAFVVELLQRLSLSRSDARGGDLLGGFFEAITREGFKQSKGLFFTHINLAVFMLKVLNIEGLAVARVRSRAIYSDRLPYIIDPSCGSGTFLLAAMRLITDGISTKRSEIERSEDVKEFLKEKFPTDHPNSWAKDFLFGIDDSELLAMSTKVNMVLHRDGNMHIYRADGLAPLATYTDQRLKDRSHSNPSVYGRSVADSFDVVISNPPFSITLDPQTTKQLASVFELASERNSENLFLERWYQLLKPGGRLGVVLPESFFSTKENLRAREFLFDHFNIKAIVGMPRHAFEPWTPTRTALLFASKKTQVEERSWKSTLSDRFQKATKFRTTALKDVRRLAAQVRDGKPLQKPDLARTMPHLKEAMTFLGIDAKVLDDVSDESFLPTCLSLIRGADPTVAAYRHSLRAVDQAILMLNITNIGYKRTRRAEYERPNDLFHAVRVVKSNGNVVRKRVLNLNLAPPDWAIQLDTKDSKDALTQLKPETLWN